MRTGDASIEERSFRAVRFRGVVAVRWTRSSEPGEFESLTRFAVDASAEEGAPVDLLAVVAPLTSMPGPALVQALERFEVATRDAVRSAHIVFVGRPGFWRTIVRSIATRLTLALGKSGVVTYHPSLDAALRRVCTLRGVDPSELRDVLDATGIGAGCEA